MAKQTKAPIKASYSCHLGKKTAVGRLSEVSEAEAQRRGLMKVRREYRQKGTGRWGEIPVWVEPACPGLETSDPVEFEAHMKEYHPERFRYAKGQNSDLVARASGMWRGPRLTADGAPFKTKDETSLGEVKTCPRCGLVAEVAWTVAASRWWDEHLELCAGVIGNCIQVGHNYSPHARTPDCLVFTPLAAEQAAAS